MVYSPNGLMRYNDSVAIVDDMPLLSQWIKKHSFKRTSVFWDYRSNMQNGQNGRKMPIVCMCGTKMLTVLKRLKQQNKRCRHIMPKVLAERLHNRTLRF